MSTQATVEPGKHQVELFDRYAADYHAKHNRHYLKGRLTFLLSRLAARPGMRILEVGTGVGVITQAISRRFPEAEVYGMDYSEGMIRNRLFTHGIVGDAERLHFLDGTFDWIIASDIIEHVEHPERLIAEAARCLKPRGRLLLTTPNPFFVPLLNFTRYLGLSLSSEKLLNPWAVKRWFSKYGFHIVAEQRTNSAYGIALAMTAKRDLETDVLVGFADLRKHVYLTTCFDLEKTSESLHCLQGVA